MVVVVVDVNVVVVVDASKSSFRRRRRHGFYTLGLFLAHCIIILLGSCLAEATPSTSIPDNINYRNNRIRDPPRKHLQLQKESSAGVSRDGIANVIGDNNSNYHKNYNNNDSSSGGGGDDHNNGLIQIIESEIWDASEDRWKGAAVVDETEGGNRWTNEKGHLSPSPIEITPPEGWKFLGEWKIVVSSSSSSSSSSSGGAGSTGTGGSGPVGGDSKGWEYQFQYLQPPRRRRIWLRKLSPIEFLPPPPPLTQSRSRVAVRPPPPLKPATGIVVKKPPPRLATKPKTNRLTRAVQLVRDDFNYKGTGFNLYKSLLFLSSFGFALRIPLSTNFDTFDRNPAWPIVGSSVSVFYPPMVAGFLSTSFHVEWVKWLFLSCLGLVPRSFFWISYRFVLPVVWAIASIALFPLRGLCSYTLPPRPTKIPSKGWWTGRNIAKPQYNSDLSEHIGCSVSYRWSRKRGYEFRVSYFHSYMPTLLVYQQFFSRLQERLQGGNNNDGIVDGSGSSNKSLSSSSSSALATAPLTKGKKYWLRKHTASLGLSTSGPMPDPPHISGSANFSLSGLYWGLRKKAQRTITSSTISSSNALSSSSSNSEISTITKGSKTATSTDTALARRAGEDDENGETGDENYRNRMSPSISRVRSVP
eukprot:CAMPEP_0168197132 /NCGR_PEP_ID=MMETSP0139_2-20121125/20959_1 /TAXON_ID=44445 /ORGANISM="Pseudo-nitzschia australis, Strain 10249 10 AB" /LENGTH=641 /DNA_ID=CAMNT_0008121499 /DNA_START=402 /DNA_END=2327 /DNA_ORIENTATION=-